MLSTMIITETKKVIAGASLKASLMKDGLSPAISNIDPTNNPYFALFFEINKATQIV